MLDSHLHRPTTNQSSETCDGLVMLLCQPLYQTHLKLGCDEPVINQGNEFQASMLAYSPLKINNTVEQCTKSFKCVTLITNVV